MSSSKKRSRSVFDAVQLLDTEDAQAESQRRSHSRRQVEQSRAAQSQTKLYRALMECRILLQRSMPSETLVEEKNKDFDDVSAELLTTLLEARHTLTSGSQNPTDYLDLVRNDPVKLEVCLDSEYQALRESWKEVLNRRHQDARLHSGMTNGGSSKRFLKVLDSSFWEQVESVVQHEELRMKQRDNHNGEGDAHAYRFEDTKVYQHLLKEFVVSHQPGQEEVAQIRLRDSSKKSKKESVDRRASKGRKLRYQEIPKLAHFTFPTSRPRVEGAVLGDDEWFRSLFGGVGVRK